MKNMFWLWGHWFWYAKQQQLGAHILVLLKMYSWKISYMYTTYFDHIYWFFYLCIASPCQYSCYEICFTTSCLSILLYFSFFFFLLNSVSPVTAAHIYIWVVSSTGAWGIYQYSFPYIINDSHSPRNYNLPTVPQLEERVIIFYVSLICLLFFYFNTQFTFQLTCKSMLIKLNNC